MIRIGTAAVIAALLLASAAPCARAEIVTQNTMYGAGNRMSGIVARDPQTGGIALGTTLVDPAGQPITSNNPLPVSLNTSISISSLTQGTPGDVAAGWYIRPGTGANMATENGNLQNLALGMGAPSTGPYSGSGDATQISALKGIFGQGAAAANALGAPGDTAWSGSGSASQIALGKRLASLMAQTATDTGLAPVSSTAVEAGRVLKASGGQLFGLQANFVTCANTPAPCWVMLLDRATLPSNGAVTPVKSYQVGSNGTLAASWPPGPPLRFANGITAVCSTTGPFTYTAAAQCAFSAEVQ